MANDEKELLKEVHVETAEERYQKNREKVKMLREKREKERLEEVEKKRDLQFRYYTDVNINFAAKPAGVYFAVKFLPPGHNLLYLVHFFHLKRSIVVLLIVFVLELLAVHICAMMSTLAYQAGRSTDA